MERQTLFVDVIVPVSIPNLFTYRVPLELNDKVCIGQRVIIPFGKNKLYTGIVRNIHENAPSAYSAKYIETVLELTPVVSKIQLKLWDWMARYYMCCIGEVMNAALPVSLKLASETKVILHPDLHRIPENLSEKEELILDALEIQGSLSIEDISKIIQLKSAQPVIKKLVDKRLVMMEEELKQRYVPKEQSFIGLHPDYAESEIQLNYLIEQLEASKRTEKQLSVLLSFLHISRQSQREWIPKKELLADENITESPLKTLQKAGVFLIENFEINRLSTGEEGQESKELSPDQNRALDEIKSHFDKDKNVLLHGVTSSGKTEVYSKLMQEAVEEDKQVLYLLPEIALTTQIIQRLKKVFGDAVGIYHSKFNPNERAEVWGRTMTNGSDKYHILVGARSSLFLPFQNLGLIIVDEEHENTFKQFDPAPRYNARDAAFVLAKMHGAKVLLGSATPAFDSYWKAEEGQLEMVEMHKRFGDVKMPEILCADIQKETRKKTMRSMFSSFLIEQMEECFKENEQIILFQNRRGFAPYWQCGKCANVIQCSRCDVSLTYHKRAHLLTCHYCGYSQHPPKKCGACGSSELEMRSFGTEKIEEEIKLIFPDKVPKRMDLDTTRSKYAYENIISEFDEGKIDILIGTQMVSKGLDFDNVGLVGILDADQMINYPDYKSFERSYQLMSQVAGRAGRKKKRGKVVIQTTNPDHWVIQHVIRGDYISLYKQEMYERKKFAYPPFFRLIEFTLKHKDEHLVNRTAEAFAKLLEQTFKTRVLGPDKPLIPRINNQFIKSILLKFERDSSANRVKEIVQKAIDEIKSDVQMRKVRIIVNVDPV